MTRQSLTDSFWVWQFRSGEIDIETLRSNRGACEGFTVIRYSESERESHNDVLQRIGGQAIEVQLMEIKS